MVNINDWMARLVTELKTAFGKKLLFVGLQGSYKRDEATKDSDIDAVVILDALTLTELKTYRKILSVMPQNDKACGFISGKQEILNWPKHELFQFKHDTLELYGTLDGLLPIIERKDIVGSVKITASALYHTSCHTFLHDSKNIVTLKNFFKASFFLLQAVYFLRNGSYIFSKKELLPLLKGEEQKILDIGMNWDKYEPIISQNPDAYFNLIIEYSAAILVFLPQS